MRVEHLQKVRLEKPADTLVNDFAAFEDEQRRDAADAEAHRGLLVLVGVQLADLHLAREFSRYGVYRRPKSLARSAPGAQKSTKTGLSELMTS